MQKRVPEGLREELSKGLLAIAELFIRLPGTLPEGLAQELPKRLPMRLLFGKSSQTLSQYFSPPQ